MTSLKGLLEALAPEIEQELQRHLRGFFGAFIRAYLPQHWSFVTEEGTDTVRIDPSGAVTVLGGAVPAPDVTVQGPRERLEQVLSKREKRAGKVPDLAVVAHTARGRAALEQVRARFGL